jgi:hypothetical protein
MVEATGHDFGNEITAGAHEFILVFDPFDRYAMKHE